MLTQTTLQKIFAQPQRWRNSLLLSKLIKGEREHFPGKSFVCVSLTRFCSVGCPFCFFKSSNPYKLPTLEDKFFSEGQEKFVAFVNQLNLGYLLVSGGGEPMTERSMLLKIIREVDSDRIVLVTSGDWAKEKAVADFYLTKITEALARRRSATELTVRLSLDEGHLQAVGLEPALNLVALFKEKYAQVPGIDLRFHTFESDPSMDLFLERVSQSANVSVLEYKKPMVKDGISALKFVPLQTTFSIDRMILKVGYAKIFYPDLRVDLRSSSDLKAALEVFEKDIFESEEGNPALVPNRQGVAGLDFCINYNGNVNTWENQFLDNLMNIYTDSAQEVIEKVLEDPAMLSFIEKGVRYRDRIVSEVNPGAVLRSKAVNIRDYAAPLMFDEARTRLYYTLRALQDYIHEGRIPLALLQKQPELLRELLGAPIEALQLAYKNADYTIVEQTLEKGFSKSDYLDILTWIKLGHYSLNPAQVDRLLASYNRWVPIEERLISLRDVPDKGDKLQIVRMTEHVAHIKPAALTTFSADEQQTRAEYKVCL